MPRLERLWASWRMRYINGVDDSKVSDDECPFCAAPAEDDAESLVVERGATCYTILNLFPYTSGHLMVIPYRHVGDYDALTDAEAADLTLLSRRAVAALRSEYNPGGFNLGANIGRAAGAGLPRHFHLHVLPRWDGDTNFVTTVSGLRVLPEDLAETRRRVAAALEHLEEPPRPDVTPDR